VDEWTSLFLLHWVFLDLRKEIFALFFLLLWLSQGHFIGFFRKERLAQNDSWKIEIGSCKIRNVNPHHFLPLENFLPVLGIEPLHSQSCLLCIYCKAALMQTWKLDNSSLRWGLRPYTLRFHVKKAGADAKLTQHGPLPRGCLPS
jgi:hypothetical protein